jgi:hypothetical protein
MVAAHLHNASKALQNLKFQLFSPKYRKKLVGRQIFLQGSVEHILKQLTRISMPSHWTASPRSYSTLWICYYFAMEEKIVLVSFKKKVE